MNDDKLLTLFFQPQRWQYALEKGIGKDIRKDQLRQLTKPTVRAAILAAMREGKYRISPPHTAQIPKDTPGEFRTVYVNEPIDRIILAIANDLLFELTPEMIHPHCRSYLKGTGCGKVVQEVSRNITAATSDIVGWKSDLSKYFDSVPLTFIDAAFDEVERKHGKSALLTVIRDYYHTDLYFDEHNTLQSKFQSLKQGCSVASWLADVLLYHIDERLANLNGYYVRYSDDMLFVGPDHEQAMQTLTDELSKMQMRLNPKKVEQLTKGHWFKFLGFSIKGDAISLSSTRIKTFQHEVERRTDRHATYKAALASVNRYLYKGDGRFSWATQILPIVNVTTDIDQLNRFVMDRLRATITGKHRVGGLGYVRDRPEGCIVRGRGRNVTANRKKTGDDLPGYSSIACMRNAMVTCRAAYDTLVRQL